MSVEKLTLLVLAAQAFIYAFMLWQMIKTAKAAKESADAARDSVELAKNTERAFVLIQSVPVSRTATNLQVRQWVTFNLKNFGRSMANSVKVTGRFFGVGGELPFADIPTTSIAPQGVFQWVVDTESMGTVLGLKYEATVTYVDVFEKRHTYHCQGRYEPTSNEFVTTGSSSD